jgi:DNA-binding MarR family transcriptional regulator
VINLYSSVFQQSSIHVVLATQFARSSNRTLSPQHNPPKGREMKNTMKAKEADSNAEAGLEFCIKLSRAYATLMRRLDNGLSSVHGLSFADFMILYYLERAPGGKLRRVDLAERLGLTASGVTRSLLPLEKLGLVTRQPDPRDARVGYASLTDSGSQLLGYALTSVRSISQDATEQVPPEEIEVASALLARLAGMNSSNS